MGDHREDRDALVAALRSLLDRVANDEAAVPAILGPHARVLAFRLALAVQSQLITDDVEAWYLIAVLHWWRYQILSAGNGDDDGSTDLDAAVSLFGSLLLVDPALVPDEVRQLLPQAAPADEATSEEGPLDLHNRAVEIVADPAAASDLAKVDLAVQLLNRALAATDEGHPLRAVLLADLGSVLLTRFELTGVSTDLRDAIALVRQAIASDPGDDGHAGRVSLLSDLLVARFEMSNAPEDLEEAIALGRRAVAELTSDDPGWLPSRINLANSLRKRAERLGTPEGLDEAIDLAEEVVSATPGTDSRLVSRLTNLALTRHARFQASGNPADLDASIDANRRALGIVWDAAEEGGALGDLPSLIAIGSWLLQYMPSGHPGRGEVLKRLAYALRSSYETTGTNEHLDQALDVARRAFAETAAGDAEYQERAFFLSTTAMMRYHRDQDRTDLDECIDAGRLATDASVGDDVALNSSNLGAMLLSRFERYGSVDDLDEAVAAGRRSVAASANNSARSSSFLYNLVCTLLARYAAVGSAADIDEAEAAATQAIAAAGDARDLAECAALLRNVCRARLDRTGSTEDLDALLAAGRRAATTALAVEDPNTADTLLRHVEALWTRYGRTSSIADLDEIIDSLQQIQRVLPAGDQDRLVSLSNLADMSWIRFDRTGSSEDLDRSIEAGRRAVAEAAEDDPRRVVYLGKLASAVWDRFQRQDTDEDLDETIARYRQVLAAPAEVDRPGVLTNLGVALQARFERAGADDDLDAAVDAGRSAVAEMATDRPDASRFLTNLSFSLRTRFRRDGAGSDRDEAIDVLRRSIDSTIQDPAERFVRLSQLVEQLEDRFGTSGDPDDQDEAIDRLRQAVRSTSAGGAGRSDVLRRLSRYLRERFEHRGGNDADLDEAVDAAESALAEAEADDRSRMLTELSSALQVRYQRTGSADDLGQSIAYGRDALAATSDSVEAGLDLNNLSMALLSRFELSGALEDLDEAIITARRAVASDPEKGPTHEQLSNLSLALARRFDEIGEAENLDEALSHARRGIERTPSTHANRPRYLNNLGLLLNLRFTTRKALADIDEAVDVVRQSVVLAPAIRPERAGYLGNLGALLWARFETTHNGGDLDEAIASINEALTQFPDDHPRRAMLLNNVANAFDARYERTGAVADRDRALEAISSAAQLESAASQLRITASMRWIRSAVEAGRLAEANDAVTVAIKLLPMLVDRGLSDEDRRRRLTSVPGLGPLAAWVRLTAPPVPDAGDPTESAWTLLEAGRGVLLSQALDTREDLTAIEAGHPDLAERLRTLRVQLNRDSSLTPEQDIDPGAARRRRMELAERWNAVLIDVRALPGHERFGLPPTVEQLRRAVGEDTAVALLLTQYGGSALILTADGADQVPLPALDFGAAGDQMLRFIDAVAYGQQRADGSETLTEVLRWLWDTVTGPVLDHLGWHRTPEDGAWPRLWWIPTSILSLLPIHAAGHHDDEPGPARRAVVDRVVSSYTPTLRALDRARRRDRPFADGQVRAVVVGLDDVTEAGHAERALRFAESEARLVRRKLRTDRPALLGNAATRENVVTALEDAAWAHFACHGVIDYADPARSHLLLHDGALNVADLNRLDLRAAQLAYLSACSTAANFSRLIDEAIHLATAFQVAGFAHTVAALWDIDDALGPYVAASVYGRLTAGLDPAQAVHETIRMLREQHPSRPEIWASYVHFGP
jgi:tetratricopeptide (TPR) repeat protein